MSSAMRGVTPNCFAEDLRDEMIETLREQEALATSNPLKSTVSGFKNGW